MSSLKIVSFPEFPVLGRASLGRQHRMLFSLKERHLKNLPSLRDAPASSLISPFRASNGKKNLFCKGRIVPLHYGEEALRFRAAEVSLQKRFQKELKSS